MRPVAVVLAVLLLCACTPDEHQDTAYAPSPSSVPLPAESQSIAPAPSPEITTRPLVLVTNPRRPPLDVPESVVRWILDGTIDNWKDLGQPAAPLRLVERSPIGHLPMNAIAQEVGHAVTPAVRAISVDGVDPIRRPAAYPLQVQGPPPGPVTTVTVVLRGGGHGVLFRFWHGHTVAVDTIRRELARADVDLAVHGDPRRVTATFWGSQLMAVDVTPVQMR